MHPDMSNLIALKTPAQLLRTTYESPLTSADAGTDAGADACREAGTLCFHCGATIQGGASFGLLIGGLPRAMCCVGCQAVAQTIIDAGLEAFYDHRDAYAPKPAATPGVSSSSALPFTDAATSAAFSRAAEKSTFRDSDAVSPVREAQLYLSNVTCTACIWLAEKTLASLAGVQSAGVNEATLTANVKYDAQALTLGEIVAALDRVGLHASPAAEVGGNIARAHVTRQRLVDLGIAVLCMMQVMMLTVPLYFADAAEISRDARLLMGWASWLITIPAMAWSGRTIFVGAMRQLQVRHVGMDTPVALALLLTFITSTYSLIVDSGHLYFDAITMFIALLLGARWVESAIRGRAVNKIQRMANPQPQIVSTLPQYPASDMRKEVSAAALRVGDIVEVPPGEAIPTDGTIVRGETEVDESLLTGESLPVPRCEPQAVIGGTVNITSPILLRVGEAVGAGLLAQLARLTENGLACRPAFRGVAALVARYVAPLTILLALIAGLVWLAIDASRSFEVMVAVLVATCPCALALAAPTASAAALGAMANSGLLVVRGHFLETLSGVTDVVFDKTGTLTTGRMTLQNVMTSRNVDYKAMDRTAALTICAALEAGSIHPVAHAIRAAIGDEPQAAKVAVASSLTLRAGAGVEGVVEGRLYRLGKPAFALEFALDDENAFEPSSRLHEDAHGAATVLVLSVKSAHTWRQLAVLVFTDTLRADARDTVTKLINRGVDVHLLSGDNEAAVLAIANDAGIPVLHTHAAQTAEDKRKYICTLQTEGRRVVAIGDGVNDAPMLGAANASIGLASGASLTRLSADAVLDEGKQSLFATIASAFDIAGRAKRITQQNFAWAIAYNVVAVPLAFAGVVNPFVAALGMTASSLVVVINASRLYSWNHSGS